MKQAFRGLILVSALSMTGLSVADGEVDMEYRQSVMKSIGGHMSAMGVILKNQVRMDDLVFHARGIAGLADLAPELFPAGSGTSKSKALPAIWEQPEAFDEAMNEFVNAAEGMASAAALGEMSEIGPAIQALGGSCKGCHDDFKAE